MNEIWSKCVQGESTLYLSRKVRFDGRFIDRYAGVMALDGKKKILEVGCGPGAMAGAIKKRFPDAEITAIDRDSNFIEFAKKHEPRIDFLEGDATDLPFEDGTFDAVVSYTVVEHVPTDKFFSEQFRVLRPGGVIAVLSVRNTLREQAECLKYSEYEDKFWKKAAENDDTFERHGVGKYRLSEAELPRALEKYGFRDVRTDYAVISLTPDDPAYEMEFAEKMIEADRACELEAIMTLKDECPEDDIKNMTKLANKRYDMRLDLLRNGFRQWDTETVVTMSAVGVK